MQFTTCACSPAIDHVSERPSRSALSQPRPPATQSGGIALNGVKLVSNASLLSGFDIDVIRFLLESMLGVPTALTHYPDYITM